MLNLISDLVSFKTVHLNYQEFEKCINYIRHFFNETLLNIREFEFNENKSIIISNTESKELDIIFCGHIDVVPDDDESFELVQKGDLLYGRGVSDMKGQIAVMMKLMKELNTDKKIALILTSDEEYGGFNGVKKVLEEGYTCKVAVVPDGGFDFGLITEEKGILVLKLKSRGIGCHSSEIYKGENAILKLFDVYNKIIEKYPLPKNEDDWKTSVNLAKIDGGDALNKVPNHASMFLDIRYVQAGIKDDILDLIMKNSTDISIEVRLEGDVFFVDTENKLIKKYIEVCEKVLNRKIKKMRFPATSDGRFFTSRNIPCVMMNPIGGNIHSTGEYVSLESLRKLLEIYKKYIEEVQL